MARFPVRSSAVLTLAALVALSTGPLTPPAAELKPWEAGRSGVGQSPTTAGADYTITGYLTCLTRGASTRVRSIRPVNPTGGFEVTAFAVVDLGQDRRMFSTVEPHSLRQLALDSTQHTVHTSCDAPRMTLVAIQARRGATTGTADGFMLDYGANRVEATVDVRLSVALCAAGNPTHHPLCRD